jgi:hypothetical protein
MPEPQAAPDQPTLTPVNDWTSPSRRQLLLAFASAAALSGCGGGGGGGDGGGSPAPAPTPTPTPTPSPTPTPAPGPAVNGPAWWGYGRNAQHTAQGAVATQPLARLQWSTPVDLAPLYTTNGDLLTHYGSPAITAKNTVIVPVKTGATNGFRFDGRAGGTGALLWSVTSDYILPVHSWVPPYGVTLTPANRVYGAGAGGKLLWRDDADSTSAATQTAVFYGVAAYNAAKAACDANVFINTPLTSDGNGNIYFGFIAGAANPVGLVSGLARVAPDGSGTWVSARSASSDAGIDKVAMNCAPALSNDGKTVYVTVNTVLITGIRQSGYLLALDSATLATKAAVRLMDPNTGAPAWVDDNSTASPTVGPDGDVFYGVLESDAPNHNSRGWLLHFDSTLSQTKVPGSFGWDDTASVLPASMVPSYTGPSSYLLTTKYNNYAGSGTGDGLNKLAVLDPAQSQPDFIAGIPVMKEVLKVLGTTPDPDYYGAFREWCINTAAVDPLTKSILVNNEDGYLYRWDMVSNTLIERIQLTGGLGEAYTPTLIGPDGAVFAINKSTLFSVGR